METLAILGYKLVLIISVEKVMKKSHISSDHIAIATPPKVLTSVNFQYKILKEVL